MCSRMKENAHINIEAADGTVQPWGEKRWPLVPDFLCDCLVFSSGHVFYHNTSLSFSQDGQHLTDARSKLCHGPLQLRFAYVLLLSPTLLAESCGSVWKCQDGVLQLCETRSHIREWIIIKGLF